MKNCELCKGLARTYCESDDASLCWNCDVKVHGANFLVARHERTVLCHACQSPTPWKASGAELGVTVTVCETCVVAGKNAGRNEQEDEEEEEEERESLAGDDLEQIDDDSDDEDEEEEDGDNQVVPWSETGTPPPPASPSSSGEAESWSDSGGGEVSPRKRSREVSSDRTDQSAKRRCCSEWASHASCSAESRPSIDLRRAGTVGPVRDEPAGSCSESVIESPLRKIRGKDLRNLSGGRSGAVDL